MEQEEFALEGSEARLAQVEEDRDSLGNDLEMLVAQTDWAL